MKKITQKTFFLTIVLLFAIFLFSSRFQVVRSDLICGGNLHNCGSTSAPNCNDCCNNNQCGGGQICQGGQCKDNNSGGGGGGGGGTTVPTATPTPPSTGGGALTSGTTDYCTSTTISQTTLDAGQSLTVTSNATSSDVVSFGWWFYNLDNIDTTTNRPKPIMFTTNTPYSQVKTVAIGTNNQSITVNFSDIDKPDLNWTSYTPRPKRIEIDGYFKKPGEATWTKFNQACSVKFSDTAIDPTPVPPASCVCGGTGECATTCVYNKIGGITYSTPIKCNLSTTLFSSVPTATDKNNWCKRFTKTAGDANGDGNVNMLDYFYYVQAIYGGKVPPSVNLDFNGDGFITSVDHDILIKALKP